MKTSRFINAKNLLAVKKDEMIAKILLMKKKPSNSVRIEGKKSKSIADKKISYLKE